MSSTTQPSAEITQRVKVADEIGVWRRAQWHPERLDEVQLEELERRRRENRQFDEDFSEYADRREIERREAG